MDMSTLIPIIAAAAGGAGCCSWAILHRTRRPGRVPAPQYRQPAGVRVLGADEVRDAARRAAASEMHLARRIYERSLHFDYLGTPGPVPRYGRPADNGTDGQPHATSE